MNIGVVMEDARWASLDLSALSETAVRATLAHLGLSDDAVEVAVLGCDDTQIAALNTQFRGKSTPTNVLSWPAADLASPSPGGMPARPMPDVMGDLALGDIAIAYDTCVREAEAARIPMEDHCTHLLVHAVLHLCGYDHIDDADATLMEKTEIEILGSLGINDPYRAG